MLEFSAPGVCTTSYTRTLSFSSSTFGLTVALATFSCGTAEFVMLPAIMNAGTTIPTKNPSDFFITPPLEKRDLLRTPGRKKAAPGDPLRLGVVAPPEDAGYAG